MQNTHQENAVVAHPREYARLRRTPGPGRHVSSVATGANAPVAERGHGVAFAVQVVALQFLDRTVTDEHPAPTVSSQSTGSLHYSFSLHLAMPQRKKAKTEKSQARGSRGRSSEVQQKGKSKAEAQARKVGKKVGRLEGIMDMPLEIVREVSGRMKCLWTSVRPDAQYKIFLGLHPRDLLSLYRASKALHESLKSKRSMYIWRSCLERVDGLPPCPPGLTDPAYTALVFSPHCTVSSRIYTILSHGT